MRVTAQKFRLHDARSYKLGFLTALAAFAITAAICKAASSTQDPSQSIWPTQEWQTAAPEEEGMDSKELVKLVDLGAQHILELSGATPGTLFDSLLVVRHGKIVVEAYYAPFTAGIPHVVNSVTKAVIGTLTAIASKDGVLDSPSHRVLDFFDRRRISNVDQKKEAITVT
jgi:CubicO group peptidase (beta-lactamase class C family)